MASSPDYLRLATSSRRALTDTALDSLCDAVIIVDAQRKHLPVVLANATARRCLADAETFGLIDAPLDRWLTGASVSKLEAFLASSPHSRSAGNQLLEWHCLRGALSVATDVKPLVTAPGQLVMLTFTPTVAGPALLEAIDNLPFDLLLLDRHLTVTYASEGAVRKASIPGGLLGVSALRLTPTSALPPSVFERALEGHQFHDDALEIAASGQPTRWFEVNVQPLKNAAGIVGLVVLSIEVTERRLRRHQQTSGDSRLLALTEHARDIMTIVTPDGTLQYVSGGIRNSLGYTSEERESAALFDNVHPDDYPRLRAQFQQLVGGEIASYSEEFRIRHKDGSYRWLESSFTSALSNPLIAGVVINSRDITERKLAECRLTQREEVFRLAADAVKGVIYEWDAVSGAVHRSQGVFEVLGLEPEDLEPTVAAWCERIHPCDFESAKKDVNLGLLSGRGWTTTYRIRDVHGRYRSILERGLVQRDAHDNPVRSIGCCVDVSEIKRVTDLLAETQRIARMGGWEYSYATCELTWTDEMYTIYGTSRDRFSVSYHSMLAQFTAESQQRFRGACTRAEASGGEFDVELEIATLNDQRIWVRLIGHVELLDGRPSRAFGSMQNIQAKKVAQIALENSTGWLKLSMNMAHMHAWRWDRTTDVFDLAVVDGRRLHVPSVFTDMTEILSRVHPADRLAASRAIDNAFQQRAEVQQEFRLKTDSGRYRWYAAIARPLYDDNKAPRGLVGVIQDITKRREAEARWRRSEELLRVTTANAADMLILVDTSLCVRFINRGVVGTMFMNQILGRNIDVLLPESARARVTARLRQVLDTGQPDSYEYEAWDDGQLRYFDNRAVLVRDDGIGTGISISTRDITERKRMEQEILDISARERNSIGRDLHDGLGQELTGVALMLRGLASRLQKHNPEATESVNEIVGLVNQSIESARSLARGLLPVRTESGGLASALKELASRSRDLYGLDVSFRAEASPELNLGETDASHLYRIAQEALTNAARHGHATRVDIFLSVTRHTFLLCITDNGEGFDAPVSPYSGMGLKIMKYRAGMIGAKFEIAPNEPHGTVVRITGEQTLTAAVSADARLRSEQ
jgi:PAS domain S-box-containing protein